MIAAHRLLLGARLGAGHLLRLRLRLAGVTPLVLLLLLPRSRCLTMLARVPVAVLCIQHRTQHLKKSTKTCRTGVRFSWCTCLRPLCILIACLRRAGSVRGC